MKNNVLKTGYRRLDDKYYGGIKRGELTMLYSRPGMGKSALLSNVFLNMISQIPQTKCMFFAFDEPEKYVFEKMVCIKSGVSYWKYFNGENCTDKEKQKVGETEEWLGEKLRTKNFFLHYISLTFLTKNNLLLLIAEKNFLFTTTLYYISLTFFAFCNPLLWYWVKNCVFYNPFTINEHLKPFSLGFI